MAFVTQTKSGTFEVRFRDPTGKQRSFYPGPLVRNKSQAERIATQLERLSMAIVNDEAPSQSAVTWASQLSDKQHAKLADWGLVETRERPKDEGAELHAETIESWTIRYLDRGGWKSGTVEQLEQAYDNLKTFLGADTPLQDVTEGDAEAFRIWLSTRGHKSSTDENPKGLAHNTVRRRIGRCKELFANAVKHRVIEVSPFRDEVAATGANVENHQFIPAEWIETMIRKAPCEDWRIMLAFARYGGMRSHETRIQRWEDIDIPGRKMLVRSNKNPPTRIVPVFPELLPHLMRAKEMAPEGAMLVVTRYGAKSNTGTTLGKIIDRAKLARWPDAWQNLRRSRETELMAKYPAKDVATWIGNSVPVAMKHYAMATDEAFQRAVKEGAGTVPDVANEHPHVVDQKNPPQNPPHDGVLPRTLEQEKPAVTAKKPRKNPLQMTGADSINYPART